MRVYEILDRCRTSIISLFIIGTAFLVAPQGQDVIRAAGDSGHVLQVICFEVTLLLWSIVVWYAARFMVEQDFPHRKDTQTARSRTRSSWLERQLPRVLGASGFAVAGVAMLVVKPAGKITNYYTNLGVAGIFNLLMAAAIYVLFAVRLTIWIKVTKGKRREERLRFFSEFPIWLKLLFWTSFGGSVLLWVVVIWSLQTVAPVIGTAAIVTLGITFATIIWTAIAWAGDRYHVPAITLAIVFAGICGIFNDNHKIRAAGIYHPDKAFTARAHFSAWADRMDRLYGKNSTHPMFIITASGGGIRAAYWTAVVLANLQKINGFGDHIAAISPVSGGALGSLVYVNLVERGTPPNDMQAAASAILSRDFLSPALASLLFIDLPARFSPYPLPTDRAETLERAWERAWRPEAYSARDKEDLKSLRLIEGMGKIWKERDPFSRPFSRLVQKEKAGELPILLINGTSVYCGRRIVTTHVYLGDDFSDCLRAFDYCADMPMSTAAHMSARFTYISPAGTMPKDVKVVDGGYFDNSGATTALQYYSEIEDLVRQRKNVVPIFIRIDNGYEVAAANETTMLRKLYPELLSPLLALLNVRSSHADNADKLLRMAAEKTSPDAPNFRFHDPGDVSAPLGWYLSKAACDEIGRTQLQQNSLEFQKVRTALEKEGRGLAHGPQGRTD